MLTLCHATLKSDVIFNSRLPPEAIEYAEELYA
jgi:hypothetical protein